MTKMKRMFRALLAAAGCLLLLSCQTPEAAEVAADRGRWAFFDQALADSAISTDEITVWIAPGGLRETWDASLRVQEERLAAAARDQLLAVYTVEALNVFLLPKLQRYPQLLALVDRDGDKLLTKDELLGFDPTHPVFAAVLMATLAEHLAKK